MTLLGGVQHGKVAVSIFRKHFPFLLASMLTPVLGLASSTTCINTSGELSGFLDGMIADSEFCSATRDGRAS